MLKRLRKNEYNLLLIIFPVFSNGLMVMLCTAFFSLLTTQVLLAEGSKEINSHGGYRAFLVSSLTSSSVSALSFPFPTQGTVKVYAKAGEVINVGSSAQGFGFGTINLRAPDGGTYTSGNGITAGLIANRAQEVAGPLPNAGGYTPFTLTVTAAQEGVWEIDFVSQTAGTPAGDNPVPVQAGAAWIQPPGAYIAAFDVSVRNTANTGFLTGRVFTNVFLGILGTFNVGFNGVFYVLTKDGYQYALDNNGQAGNGFTFFVNNKGFRTPTGTVSYQSVDSTKVTNVQDPRTDDTPTDVTQKIFFNTPATDLPATAGIPGNKTTWLVGTPVVPTITNVNLVGVEGTVGRSGTSPLGANLTFTTSGNGTYALVIDVNQNGIYTDAIDRRFTGTVNAGTNRVYWDGLDGTGKKVPPNSAAAYNASIIITTTAGEVHFPFFDVERNVNGLKLTRLNGLYAPDDTLYWDDTPITIVGTPPVPLKNTVGISSAINGHKWGKTTTNPNDDQDFGNNKSIDTYGYIASAPVTTTLSFKVLEADLAVDSITAIANCAGEAATYQITVSNKGPSDIAGAKFHFTFPATLSRIAGTSQATSGTSAVTATAITPTSFDVTLSMANGSVRRFVISGIVNASVAGNFTATAAIIRPADVTDPDATNPDIAPPTDANNECDALPSGVGCNNIKSKTVFISPVSVAGPNQTVFINTPATMAASTVGTWTQIVSNDPALAVITNPTSATTNITGFSVLGLYHFAYTNASGCADTANVKVIPVEIDIPNIITPNNDGKNDVLKIGNLENYPGSQIIIFNRWGNEVYHNNDYKSDWNGSGLAEATYYYILNRRGKSGEITPYKGWVFLKRSN